MAEIYDYEANGENPPWYDPFGETLDPGPVSHDDEADRALCKCGHPECGAC